MVKRKASKREKKKRRVRKAVALAIRNGTWFSHIVYDSGFHQRKREGQEEGDGDGRGERKSGREGERDEKFSTLPTRTAPRCLLSLGPLEPRRHSRGGRERERGRGERKKKRRKPYTFADENSSPFSHLACDCCVLLSHDTVISGPTRRHMPLLIKFIFHLQY